MPYAWGGPPVSGRLRVSPEDFRVEEDLGFEPSGDGEHLLLYIRKTGLNTAQVSNWLADVLEVRKRDVTRAGLKDRHAVTDQWFGVHLPGRVVTLPVPPEGIHILRASRHRRKLRTGTLRGNRFVIRVRELQGNLPALDAHLLRLCRLGVPNWFGDQRFGRDGGNLAGALRLFGGEQVRDRQLRGMYLSAARSLLFNRVLAERVMAGTWNQALPGDLMTFSGSRSLFPADASTASDVRLHALDLHPTGPLHGIDGMTPAGGVEELEHGVLEQAAQFASGIKHWRMRAERRALRVPVADLSWWMPAEDTLELGFRLPPGSYATAVLREVVQVRSST
ncbi:MAG: tRNA pseudouridine(13) synthase TruD [Ectothiorhodospiraceae bacterium]|nr:tRNA pseudouridine(13) synthase TruD [Ectothiorhodospiraceae bacterium]